MLARLNGEDKAPVVAERSNGEKQPLLEKADMNGDAETDLDGKAVLGNGDEVERMMPLLVSPPAFVMNGVESEIDL